MNRDVTLKGNTDAYHAYFGMVREQLEAGESVKLAFGGTSMLPTLNATDKIVASPLEGEPRKGDVLLFCIDGLYIVHRMVGRDGDMYLMQGDHNWGTERVGRDGLLARIVAVEHADGSRSECGNREWQRTSRCALARSKARRLAMRWLGRNGRRQLRPWYFAALAILMWAPLNGVGIPLDNYILGLRLDHLLHASVYIPCTLFLMDVIGPRWLVWLAAVAVGLITEGGQWILPFRGFDINDLFANAIGVTLGWLVVLAFKKRKSRRA